MALKDDLNKYRRQILFGTETKKEDQPEQPPQSKLAQMLTARKAQSQNEEQQQDQKTQESEGKNEQAQSQQQESQETKEEGQEQAPQEETTQIEAGNKEIQEQPVLTLESLAGEIKELKELVVAGLSKEKPEQPEKQDPPPGEIAPDDLQKKTEAQQPEEQAQQAPEQQSEPNVDNTSGNVPVDSDSKNETDMERLAFEEGRRNLDKQNMLAKNSRPIGDVLAEAVGGTKIPAQNRGLLIAAVMNDHGSELTQENAKDIVNKVIVAYPALSIARVPFASGSTSSKEQLDMKNLTMDERAKILEGKLTES